VTPIAYNCWADNCDLQYRGSSARRVQRALLQHVERRHKDLAVNKTVKAAFACKEASSKAQYQTPENPSSKERGECTSQEVEFHRKEMVFQMKSQPRDGG
jgi:phosphopantetheinyl transferase (holo-ACP synthase)